MTIITDHDHLSSLRRQLAVLMNKMETMLISLLQDSRSTSTGHDSHGSPYRPNRIRRTYRPQQQQPRQQIESVKRTTTATAATAPSPYRPIRQTYRNSNSRDSTVPVPTESNPSYVPHSATAATAPSPYRHNQYYKTEAESYATN